MPPPFSVVIQVHHLIPIPIHVFFFFLSGFKKWSFLNKSWVHIRSQRKGHGMFLLQAKTMSLQELGCVLAEEVFWIHLWLMESWKLLKMGTVLSIFNNNSFLSSCDAAGNDENWDCGIWQWRAIVSSILLIEDPLFFVETVILFFYFPGRILHTKKNIISLREDWTFCPLEGK